MLARTAFAEQSLSLQQASRILDAGVEGGIPERRFLGRGCHYLVLLGLQVLDIHSHLGHLGCGSRVRLTAGVEEPVVFT